ncbi:MAG: DUF975 family protein [Intestinibacillus sp.]
MYYNPEARKAIKNEAKGKVLGQFWPAMLACAVCRLPSLLIGVLLPLAGVLELAEQIRLLAEDSAVSLPRIQALAGALWSRMMLVALLITVFDLLLTGPLYMGLRNYWIKLYRGGIPTLSETVGCFASGAAYGRAFLTNLWIHLRWLGWMLLLLPSVLLLGMLMQAGAFLTVLGVIAYFVLVIWIWVKVQTYDGAYNFLHDTPEMPPREAVRLAGILFRGRLWELLVFLLSFLGWVLLLSLPGYALSYLGYNTLGTLVDFALGLFLIAYQGTAFAGYVDAIWASDLPEDGAPGAPDQI